jgi:hypothetical protein
MFFPQRWRGTKAPITPWERMNISIQPVAARLFGELRVSSQGDRRLPKLDEDLDEDEKSRAERDGDRQSEPAVNTRRALRLLA